MITILVVDDMAIFRDPIAASLRLGGYRTLCAADGEEALQLTRLHRPDLILLDVSMPRMDGIAFLRQVRAEPSLAAIPVILLTALTEKRHVLAAAQLGVSDYLLKSRFRLSDLLDRIKRAVSTNAGAATTAAAKPPVPAQIPTAGAAIAAPAAPTTSAASSAAPAAPASVTAPASEAGDIVPLLTREQFLNRIERAFEAKTLSGVVAQVIATASSARGDMTHLASLIAQDPMLSARVLQAANSACYASTGAAVTNIPDAIRKLGFTTVRNVAAALGVFDCMPEVAADGFDPIRCWQHSFAVAQLCEQAAAAKVPDQAGLAYVVGLCHDLGDIFIRTQFSSEYQQVIEAAKRTGQSEEQLHEKMLGLKSAEMISAVLRCMSLPTAIREPIEILHSPGAARSTNPLARILLMAESYANASMIASSPHSSVAPLTQAFCLAAVGEENPPRLDPAVLRAQVLSLTVTLARLSAAEEAKLLVPMFKKTRAKLWVARDPAISESDPVGLALESLAEIAVNQRLPQPREAAEVDAVVVISATATTPGFSPAEVDAAITAARASGRTLPIMAITSGTARVGPGATEWRRTATLEELASFVASLMEVRRPVAVAA